MDLPKRHPSRRPPASARRTRPRSSAADRSAARRPATASPGSPAAD